MTSYLRDMYSAEEIPDLAGADFRNSEKFSERRVSGLPYRDPDSTCRRLYEDLRTYQAGEGYRVETVSASYGRQLILISPEGRSLSSDYIGPSLTAMFRAGMDDRRAWELTVGCRILGGHMLLPRGELNTAKARSGRMGYGISDRVDVFLYEVRCLLEGRDDPPLNKKLRESLRDPCIEWWLRGLDFAGFCQTVRFVGSFVDDRGEILWLTDPEPRPLTLEQMEELSRRNLAAILRRQEIILG